MWCEVEASLDAIQPGLFGHILDKSLLKNESYLKLVRSDDGEEYSPNNFQESRTKRFSFILLTSSRQPNEDIVDRCYTIRILISQKGFSK